MSKHNVFNSFEDLIEATRSEFFKGHSSDTAYDRNTNPGVFLNDEALFTQSNARALIGQTASGNMRFISVPTQVYAAPTMEGEFGLSPGMYYHTDFAMYVGDLSYSIVLEDGNRVIDLSDEDRNNETVYAHHFLPLTTTKEDNIEIMLLSFAPVASDSEKAPLAPAPLPGPSGGIYVLHVKNNGTKPLKGKIILKANDQMIGHYEDLKPEMKSLKSPSVDIRQQTLILSRPDGSVGIQLHGGKWIKTTNIFEAEIEMLILPGEDGVFETHIAIGEKYLDIMPTIYTLHLMNTLDWLNCTADFWLSRLGKLKVEASYGNKETMILHDIYIRSLFDNFNCLQTDESGNLLAHWQGAPSHYYGTIWGIDIEPTATSVAIICPEIARQVMLFFLNRSRVPLVHGSPDHSLPIMIAPVVIAGFLLQNTGDLEFFKNNHQIVNTLKGIMDEVLTLKASDETLFSSRYSSDGPVGRRYDYAANVKTWYAFNSLSYILDKLECREEAVIYKETAEKIKLSIEKTMIIDGPFGKQISGGTNLGEEKGTFYLPEHIPYYDGEDTSTMLAPIYGMCDFNDEPWINYHRFARSILCNNYDPEFDTLLWNPAEPMALDGTALVSRIGGSRTCYEMKEAVRTLVKLGIDDATGSLFWWPSGFAEKRAVTRCSQGQGAWAWQYLQQWLGLKVDAVEHVLTLAPQGLVTEYSWEGFVGVNHNFDIYWNELKQSSARVINRDTKPWEVKVGFRQKGAGCEGGITWQSKIVDVCEEVIFVKNDLKGNVIGEEFTKKKLVKVETELMADKDGIVFKRYGPAYFADFWHWDNKKYPLAIRFIIANGTTEDWTDGSVELKIPEGWTAEGREPGYRNHKAKEKMTSGSTCIKLGKLVRLSRTVAAFSVRRPNEYSFIDCYSDDYKQSFHLLTQPGNDINLYSKDVVAPVVVECEANLEAITQSGKTINKKLNIFVRFLPFI